MELKTTFRTLSRAIEHQGPIIQCQSQVLTGKEWDPATWNGVIWVNAFENLESLIPSNSVGLQKRATSFVRGERLHPPLLENSAEVSKGANVLEDI